MNNVLAGSTRIVVVLSLTLISLLPVGSPARLEGRASAQDTGGRVAPEIFKKLQFRALGPAIMGGRIDDFAVVEGSPHIIYVATASGGLWKTINNGTTWEPLFDDQSVSSIGDVAIAPSDPNIVWVGTGEANNRQSSSWGNGVYRSLDGGKTWHHAGLKETYHIGRIVVDPRDPNVAYVAAAGRLWGPSRERGLFKTTDGGKTWTNTKFINEDTGFIDVAIDPESPSTLYAAAYQRRRTPWGFNGGGPGSGLYKTTDGGATWTKLTEGLPEGDTGRIGIDIYRRDPSIVYALIENKNGGTFRTEDKGATWKRVSETNPRAMYYSQVRIDPNNDQRIWVLGASMYVSEDGGKTFQTSLVQRIHGDYHAMWIDPANSQHMITGSDGGIHFSWDRGRTWEYVNTIPLGQFYEIGYDFRKPYWVYGGLQDNGSWGAPVATLNFTGPSNDEWIRVGGGDGFYNQVDPEDPMTVYTESQNGSIQRVNLGTGESKSIRPQPDDIRDRYRFDWDSPIFISPHNHRRIMLGGNRLFVSNDRGDTWTSTPDLTKNIDRNKLEIMGVVPGPNTLSRHDGQENFGQILTIAESPMKQGVLWVGTDDGNIQVSRDDGKTWKNVVERVPGVPKNTYVSRVIASRAIEGRAYATFDGHRSNDFKTYVFVTEDFGETWRPITSNLPPEQPVKVIREHPRNQNLLFVGTEFGVFVSFNRGGEWMPLKLNLPTVPVDDIAIHPRDNDLILATHGRSIWVLDDMTPFEQMSDSYASADAQLFDPRPAMMYRLRNHKGSTGHKTFIAQNPPAGAIINYYLRTKADNVKCAILDRTGNTIRELQATGDPGIQRITWDLRYASPVAPSQPGAGAGGGGGGGGGGGAGAGGFGGAFLRGPRVLPGEYRVRLSVGGREIIKPLVVEEDSRIQLAPADAEARLRALLALNRMQKAGDEARRALLNLRTQLDSLQDALKKETNVSPSISSSVTGLIERVSDLQRRLAPTPSLGVNQREEAGPSDPSLQLAVVSRIGQLFNSIDSYTEPLSQKQTAQVDSLGKVLSTLVEDINRINAETIPSLNRQIAESGITMLKAAPRITVLQ